MVSPPTSARSKFSRRQAIQPIPVEDNYQVKSIMKVTTLEQSLRSSGRSTQESSTERSAKECLLSLKHDTSDALVSNCTNKFERGVSFSTAETQEYNSDDDLSVECLLLSGHNTSDAIMSNCAKAFKNKVSFSTVEIREYRSVVGDNPSVSVGPPISIGWEYAPAPKSSLYLEDYEKHREPIKSESELKLPLEERVTRLLSLGYNTKQLNEAANKAKKARLRRLRTKTTLYKQKNEEILESVSSKVYGFVRCWGKIAKGIADDEDELWTMAQKKKPPLTF